MGYSKGIVLLLSTIELCAAAPRILLHPRGPTPNNPYDENSTPHCTWWHDYDEAVPCNQLLDENFIDLEQFRRWNPSISDTCEGLTLGRSYCVEASFEPPPPETETPTPTGPSNGIETPQPAQPNIDPNCDRFHLVQQGESCDGIAAENGITLAQFLEWNPSAGSTCAGLWADAYACVSIIGHEPATPTTTEPAPTQPTNGIETPQPTQPNMVRNCDKFHFVERGEDCTTIASANGITQDQFHEWNPSAGTDCAGLWADTYACVSIIGHDPTPTDPGNGIETPTPTQPDMVDNCDEFYLVKTGDSCATIASDHGISLADFLAWNPKAGSNCVGLWSDAYACVSIIGHDPTPTDPGNGIETPTPTQPDMVDNCNKFYLVKTGDSCATIADKHDISLSDFLAWNPQAGSTCSGLWSNAYACVSIIGYTPTPTDPGNGIETPTPTQPGMVDNCKKFHFVAPGQNCPVIQAKYGVTLAQLVRWNPAIKADCTGMWAETYICVGV